MLFQAAAFPLGMRLSAVALSGGAYTALVHDESAFHDCYNIFS